MTEKWGERDLVRVSGGVRIIRVGFYYNTISEGKLTCSHHSCTAYNVFKTANDILHHYTVSLQPTELTFSDTRTVYALIN